jgi:sodium transport system ATP-binding protein
MIEVEHLVKQFKKFVAVEDVSFIARQGEVLGLLGANGAGKSTTMRIISATLKPTSGTVRVSGFDVARQPDQARRALGVMPETWGLYGHLNPRDHLIYIGELFNMPRPRLLVRVDELIETLQMQEFATRPCKDFSKGMRQKVNLARTLLHEPPNLLLDEPTSGLDVMSSRHVRELVQQLKRTGKTIILSTHVFSEAERMCDRIVIMDRGKKIAEGTTSELCTQASRDTLEEAFVHLIGREDVEVQR